MNHGHYGNPDSAYSRHEIGNEFTCPKCQTVRHSLPDSQVVICKGCGVALRKTGNALRIGINAYPKS